MLIECLSSLMVDCGILAPMGDVLTPILFFQGCQAPTRAKLASLISTLDSTVGFYMSVIIYIYICVCGINSLT